MLVGLVAVRLLAPPKAPFRFSQVSLWGVSGLVVQCAQPRVQRTRLRRAPTEAVSSQKTFARQVAGQTRRAADALVGQQFKYQ